jgi:YHS domain-containing protein
MARSPPALLAGTSLAAAIPAREDTPMEIDVVCGMEVDPTDAPAQSEHDGKIFYFCSEDCLHEFEDDPETYTARHTAV